MNTELEIKKLKGLSGCTLHLLEDEKSNYSVLKISSSESYNERLLKQCSKQENFKKFKHIVSPHIFDRGISDGLAYFRMEFIKGQTLADFLKQSDISSVLPILDELLFMLCKSKVTANIPSAPVFEKKINSLKQNCSGMPYFSRAFEQLEKFDWTGIPNTSCHGDLTAENIIISGNQIYLIDFLDSFYNTWLIDVAKLLQDFELGWSFRNTGLSIETELKMKYCANHIRNFIQDNVETKQYLCIIDKILLLNVCRIFPYAQDSVTVRWLRDKIEYLLIEKD